MCQILFCEKQNPDLDVLKVANEGNSHGFGYAWAAGEKVRWKKGFDKEQFDAIVPEFLSLPFPKAIHFRYATHGGISKALTHPFPVKRGNSLALEGEAPWVLFHNGVWGGWDDAMREAIFGGTLNPNILREPMSDSRAMAILCQRFGPDILDVLNIGSNKVLVLGPQTWYRYGTWTQRVGFSASNSKVERPAPTPPIHIVATNRKREDSLPLVYSEVTEGGRRSRYLDASREEIEETIASWGGIIRE